MKRYSNMMIALAMMFIGGVVQAATQQDGIGAIRSIDRCDEHGVVYTSSGSIDDALTVGDKAYFRIRRPSRRLMRRVTHTFSGKATAEAYAERLSACPERIAAKDKSIT